MIANPAASASWTISNGRFSQDTPKRTACFSSAVFKLAIDFQTLV
jgi:hypothetical protein